MKKNLLASRLLVTLLAFAVLGQGPVLRSGTALCCVSHAAMLKPGTHCPFMHAPPAQQPPSAHNCPMHQAAPQRQPELRCHCPSSSPTTAPETDGARCILPLVVPLDAPTVSLAQWKDNMVAYRELLFAPPDPPPRSFPHVSL
jgi:hypothetical protein